MNKIKRWTAEGAARNGIKQRSRRGVSAWFALAAIVVAGPAAAELDRAATQADMRAIYASIATLLPLSVDDAAFRSPEERVRIRTALAQLAGRAEHVGSHIAGDDRRIRYLARSLSRETNEALRRFEEGRFESAQFVVRRLTDFCVACHTRIPSPADSPVARGFVSDATLAKLAADERASIQVATRRFDDALTTYEALFASPSVQPAELLEPLSEYLRVSIRVKNDLERPRPILRKFVARPDLWSNLRGDVNDWLAALDKHVGQPQVSPSPASANKLLDEAQRVMRYPADRRGLVQQLLASSELHRYLERHAGQTGRDVAEAYYLLGLIESRTNFNYLVSESDFYLETAIRMAPGDPIGEQAFDLLEEETVLGWTGSSGDHMPADVRRNLDALRDLVVRGAARDSAED